MYHGPRRAMLTAYLEPLDRLQLDGYVYPAIQMPPPDETMPQDGRLSEGPHSATSWVNMIGVPAVVVPAGFYASGLPFGLEFSARPWTDGDLLGIAHAWEQATRHCGSRRCWWSRDCYPMPHDAQWTDGSRRTMDDLTRRDFVAMSVAAGLGGRRRRRRAPRSMPVIEKNVEIKTPDGTCDAAFIHPATGAHAGRHHLARCVRPAPVDARHGKRLAGDGYSVLVPNPFYRVAKAPVFGDIANFDFANPADRAKLKPMMGVDQRAPATPKRTRPRSSPGSMRSRRWTRPRRSARRATAWAARSSCARRRRCRTASAPAPRSTAAAW